jgi:SulP family sulfate permease
MNIEAVPADFVSKWSVYAQNMDTINPASLIIGIVTVLIIAITPKFSKKIPGSLIAIVLMTIIVYFLREKFGMMDIETIGDRFSINASLPKAARPVISFDIIQRLMPAAFTIAILGAIESLLSATVADGVIGDKHHSNTELIAQGIANIVAPIFGGIPATGAIARTMTNINNGGKTPVAGIIHAIVLLLILLFLGNLTRHIPMACLAGVLVIVAYNMSEWRTFKSLMKGQKSDVAVLVATFLLTVIFDLTIAIEIGLVLAVVLFLRRISESSQISIFKHNVEEAEYIEGNSDTEKLILPKGVEVYEIEGPFFFGVANKFEETMKMLGDKPKVRIIRMRKVPFIDSTGIHNLESLIRMSQKDKTRILLSGVNNQVHNALEKAGIQEKLGVENICDNITDAIKRAEEIVSNK